MLVPRLAVAVAAALLLMATITRGSEGFVTLDEGAAMQSRAVDTRIQLEILEGQPRGTLVGSIPIKPGFTYRFNEPPREFTLEATTGEISTTIILDREVLRNDRYDLVVLSSQPTYPIEVRILVLDMNDNSPEFPEPSIAVSFSESAASGTRLLLDAATDLDIGNNGISDDYRIVDGNLDEKFKLVVTANPSGEITYLHLETTGKLDRETCSFYKLNVSARDGGSPPRFGFLLVNVTILDVNDNPPIFDHSDYIVSLNESVPSGTAVLQVMATDSDVGDNARITYYLSDTERQFTVDPETGIISTTEILDCPQQNCLENAHTRPGGAGCPKSCVFTVFARDHGSPRQDGRTYVTVNLVDANDHDPIIKFRYFPSNSAFATVDENAGNGSVVAAVSVVDHDQGLNGDTTVEIKTGNELNHFRLEYTPSFYLVRVHGILDREEINKYNLTIVATDKGSPPRTATSFLIIHVNDVNDHEPVFEKSEYSAILSELAPPGTYVAGITATDEDSGVNAQIYYSFVFGNEHQWFEMDPVSGLITTKTTLDREVQDTVELRISARDGGPNPKWAYSQLKVTILDENDERPTFSQQQINVSLSESTPGNTLVAMLTASDHDQGTNGSVTYLLDADVDGFYPDTFALDSLTGQLTTKSKLDRETIAFYEIRVIARDQGIPPQSSTATVFLTVLDVNDNSPQFYPQLYYVLFSETTISNQSPLVQVVATDRDEDERSMIRYSLAQPQHSKEFELDENTGILTVRNSFLVSAKDSFKLRVRARDLGERWADHDAEIELINEERLQNLEFDSSNGYEFSIGEDHGRQEASIGRQLGRIQVKPASFRREEELLYYAIIQGDPFYMFNINKNTGIITTSNVIDREQQSSYTLNVIARSTHGYGSTFVNITILDENDNAPAFFRPKDEIVIAENAAVGQEVFLARAKDLDSAINSRITYSLSYNPEQQFRIAESTGVLYLNRPINIKPGISINIEVTATDSGEVPLSSRHIISITVEDVNDHTPVFDHTSYETSLLESTPVNARFFAIRASDFDLGDNGQVKYTISEGDIEAKFGIFPDGFLYVRNPLDREERDYYSLVVTAMDHGNPPRSSSVPVVIHVIDENDNSPKFSNSTFVFYVRENEPPDSFVGKLIANDRDMGRNAELTFTLTNSQRDFAIDPKNGFIKTLHIFDREELVQSTGQSLLTLEAIVSDNGVIRLSDRVKINVYVTDENDNAPKFLRIPYKVQISEGASVGTQIFRVFTTDADEGLNGDVFYSISEGNQEGRFSIEETTGQILVAKTLDRESTSRYILTVIAQDAGLSVRLSSSVSVVIDILDENDNAPEFIETSPSIIVSEVTSVGTELIQFKATDADLDINSEVNFSIGAGNRRDTFHIDALTGTLYLHKPLDYEELTSYTLNITVSDGGNPRLSSTLLFQVTVEDANDNAPIFPNTAIVRQIREGIPVNTPIVTVTAEDPDSGVNGNVIYHISHEEPAGGGKHFGINPNSGVIHTLLPIDREAVDTFKLTVVAMDQALNESMRMSAEKLVTVIVEDVNDNAPLFVSMNAAVLPRKATEGTIVMHVLARDLDSSTNGLVTYEMVSGNTDLFRLHRSTGILSLRRTISSPTDNSDALMKYHIAVKATDEAVQAERKSTDAYVTLLSIDTERTGPIFDTAHLTGTVLENEPPGTNVVRIEASWPTGGQGTELEYYVTNVTSTSGRQLDRLFDIDTKMGVLSTTAELDREAGADVYVVEVFVVAVGMAAASSNKVGIFFIDDHIFK